LNSLASKTAAVLLMGGSGERFGSSLPKQFHRLAGKKIYQYTLQTFIDSSLFEEILLVSPQEWISQVREEVPASIRVICGGSTRQESSYLGISACKKGTEIVLIHDAVRPFVSFKILKENIEKARLYKAVDTCIPSADTIVHSKDRSTISQIPSRAEYLRGQTPQTFSHPLILEAHLLAMEKGLTNISDDCRLVIEAGSSVHIVEGSEDNLKITSQLDLFLAEQILRLQKHTVEIIEKTDSLKGKNYAVVGGTGGIGKWICALLEQEGANPLIISRGAPVFKADLSDKESIANVFQKIQKMHGPLDGLINAAGFLRISPFEKLSLSEIEHLLAVNFTGLLFACKSASLKSGGHIINIASSSFTRGRKDYGVYSSAKAAVVNFSQSLAEERTDLHINVVVPQRTDTPMRRENFPGEKKQDLLDPKVVAQTVLSLLKDQKITGSIIEVRHDTR
jgi:ribitol-5-phosphate 2-dehydrogenase (NADP+) / D-ribitol-5-phosphate cytidylyltransferase